MTTLQSPQVIGDRIKLPFSFDASKMLREYSALQLKDFEYYNVIQLRAPAHIVDPSRPIPPPADDYADGSWTEWMDTNELNKSPYIKSIVDSFKEITTVTLVRLLSLAPHSEVREHTDPTLGLEVERSVIRLTIPIVQNKDVRFYLNDIPVDMELGDCWYLKLTDKHRVVNSGTSERVNLTIDMVPNENVRTLLQGSMKDPS